LALELYVPAPSAPGHRRWTDELTVGDRTVRREYERSATDPRLLVGRTDGRSWRLRPLPLDELDALARDAGFEPEYRWQSWRREPFLAARGTHVSVWTTSTGSGSPMPSPAPGSAG
jgi:hypothetical protein